jgi:hypothetical protein
MYNYVLSLTGKKWVPEMVAKKNLKRANFERGKALGRGRVAGPFD